jgi:hypothetical protein
MAINYCSFTLLHDNESKAAQYCCVAKDRNNVVLVHFYVAGHRRHDVTETITCNSIYTHTHAHARACVYIYSRARARAHTHTRARTQLLRRLSEVQTAGT